MGFGCTIIGKLHVENEKDLPHWFRPAHTFQYFNWKLSIIIAITAAMLDLMKIWNMCFCCIIIGKLHVENKKDLPHRFRPAHTFLYFSCKLSIIIAIAAAMLDFLKILNMGFCCTIIGKFYAKNKNDPPHRFRAAQPVTHGRTDTRTDEVNQITLRAKIVYKSTHDITYIYIYKIWKQYSNWNEMKQYSYLHGYIWLN